MTKSKILAKEIKRFLKIEIPRYIAGVSSIFKIKQSHGKRDLAPGRLCHCSSTNPGHSQHLLASAAHGRCHWQTCLVFFLIYVSFRQYREKSVPSVLPSPCTHPQWPAQAADPGGTAPNGASPGGSPGGRQEKAGGNASQGAGAEHTHAGKSRSCSELAYL